MNKPLVIGIVGKIGTGKGTLGTMLETLLLPAKVRRAAFATALKEHVHDIILEHTGVALTPDQIQEYKANILGPLYQGWGELYRELVDCDHWVKLLEAEEATRETPTFTIIDDVRYVNEAFYVLGRRGVLVGLVGPNWRTTDQRSPAHRSETEVDEVLKLVPPHLVYANFKTTEHLRDFADKVMQEICDRIA